MADEHDAWLQTAFGTDVPSIAGSIGEVPAEHNVPANVGVLAGPIFAAAGEGLSSAGPAIAVGGAAGVAVVAAGVVIGAAAPAVIGYLTEHGKEVDSRPDEDERSLPGGAGPDLRPDGGVPTSDTDGPAATDRPDAPPGSDPPTERRPRAFHDPLPTERPDAFDPLIRLLCREQPDAVSVHRQRVRPRGRGTFGVVAGGRGVGRARRRTPPETLTSRLQVPQALGAVPPQAPGRRGAAPCQKPERARQEP